MARPAALAAFGVSGAYIAANPDIVGNAVLDGLLGKSTVPSSSSSNRKELEQAIRSLTTQIEMISRNQHSTNSVLVTTSHPTTILGLPRPLAVIILPLLPISIFLKVRGYSIRDFVYVSKHHFDGVVKTLKEKGENILCAVENARRELGAKIGLLDDKILDTEKSVLGKIDTEVATLNSQIDQVATNVAKLDKTMEHTAKHLDGVSTNLNHVKKDIKRIGDGIDNRLAKMHGDVESMRNFTMSGHTAIKRDMSKIDTKIDDLTTSTQNTLTSLDSSLEKQSRGVQLLCEFVRNSLRKQSGKSGALTPRGRRESAGENDVVVVGENDGVESQKWFEELVQFTREQRGGGEVPQAIVRPGLPLMRKRSSSGLVNIKGLPTP